MARTNVETRLWEKNDNSFALLKCIMSILSSVRPVDEVINDCEGYEN